MRSRWKSGIGVLILVIATAAFGLSGCGSSQSSGSQAAPSSATVNFEGDWTMSVAGAGVFSGTCTASAQVTVSDGQFSTSGELLATPSCNDGQVPSQTFQLTGTIDSSGAISGTMSWDVYNFSFTGTCNSSTGCSAQGEMFSATVSLSR